MNKLSVFLLALSSAGAALAQDAPTGVVRSGGISLIRSEGKVSLGPLGTFSSTTDIFGAGFQSIDYSKITPVQTQIATIGSCVVSQFEPQNPTEDPKAVTLLDAGPVLTLSGPNGSKQFPSNKFAYGGILGGGAAVAIPGFPPPAPLYLEPGTYTVDNGGGGADVGPFKATLTLPAPFSWTNADANLSIDRSAGVDVAWVGGDPGTKVFISGSMSLIDAATFRVTGGAGFVCLADNPEGHFFVPPEVLTLLPATVVVNNVPTSVLTVNNVVQTKFDAPGTDLNTFTFLAGGTRTVEYK